MERMNSLSALLKGIVTIPSVLDMRVHGLSGDSRELRSGDAFLALRGSHGDAWRYADEALENGAVAILAEVDEPEAVREWNGVLVVPVPGLARLKGWLADRFYGRPSLSLSVVGVTGTNGKTSVTRFLTQILNGAGISTASLGTLGYGFPGSETPASHTTPDAVRMQRLLDTYRQQGAQAVVMEVSSHALDQGRVDEVAFSGAILTNLSQDHLDYHGSMMSYGESKAALFTRLKPVFAVINKDDEFGRTLLGRLQPGCALWCYSLAAGDADLYLTDLTMTAQGFVAQINGAAGPMELKCGLMGRFNVANVLAAVGAALALDVNPATIEAQVASLTAPPGRLEVLAAEGRPRVIVDYAHTPDALQSVLSALRPHVKGKLWCVFGCGGDRDQGKRPLMGAAAEKYADRVIITDDNPRSEDPTAIVTQILAGMNDSRACQVVHDRGDAIAHAIAEASPEDVVLVAGKGHENTQERQGQMLPFSDRDTVSSLLTAKEGSV